MCNHLIAFIFKLPVLELLIYAHNYIIIKGLN